MTSASAGGRPGLNLHRGIYMQVRRGRSVPTFTSIGDGTDLLFIDVEGSSTGGWPGAVADQIRFAELSALEGINHILIRPPTPGSADDPAAIVRDTLQQMLDVVPFVGVLAFKVGERGPVVHSIAGDTTSAAEVGLLTRARALELQALLTIGRAHWKPTNFHFSLPSGVHRADFIRIGDAFRHPRDAEAVATWMYGSLSPGVALLADSSTVVPILQALRSAAAAESLELGAVAVRDDYPDAILRDEVLVELAVGATGVLAILSVSSTGRTADTLSSILGDKGSPWQLEVLVARTPGSRNSPSSVRAGEFTGQSRPWLVVPEITPALEDGKCALCKGASQAPVVRIDPGAFSNTVLPEPAIKAMPDPPNRDREIDLLLEMYDRVDGIGIDCEGPRRTQLQRLRGRVGLRFYPQTLLNDPSFLKNVGNQLRRATPDWRDGRSDLETIAGFDCIVVLESDEEAVDGGTLEPLCKLVSDMYGNPRRDIPVARVSGKTTQTALRELRKVIRERHHILILTLGSVTGGTLQEVLIKIGAARNLGPDSPYEVSALVLHARPRTFDEWRAMRSSFYNRLVAVWLTYMPSDHPFEDEQTLYRDALDRDELSAEAAAYEEGRRRWVIHSLQDDWLTRRSTWDSSSGAPNPAAVMLCTQPERASHELPRLLPGSRFGDRMSMVGVLAGVGTTLHRSRLERQDLGGPPGLRFDLTRIPVVYFESPIIAAVLRWIRPSEAFWEHTGRSAEDVVRECWERAQFEQPGSQILLLAELLLAGASGRLPRHAGSLLRDLANELRTRVSATEFAPVEIGLQLIGREWPDEFAADSTPVDEVQG